MSADTKDLVKKLNLSKLDTDNSEVVSSVRDVPPAHYIMKIEGFSLLPRLLQTSGVDNYESNDFEASGYKWKLLLHPEGNKKRGVNGHLSLYLALSDATKLALGSEVNVIFKFFVFDQIREKYLTLEDGNVRQFNLLKTERGISRLLSLNVFNDPAHGYMVDDCCIFGAEVFVVKSQGIGESLKIINEPRNATIVWKIGNFSGLKNDWYYSELLDFEGCKWRLLLYPSGNCLKVKGKSLSLFLRIHDISVLPPGTRFYVAYELIMKDQVHGKNLERQGNHWFCSSSLAWGFAEFIALTDLNNQKNGYIVNDTLILEAKITFISVVNCFA